MSDKIEQHFAELWQPIPNYNGYEISNKGNIRSLNRTVKRKDGTTHNRAGKKMYPSTDTRGYLQIKLTNTEGIRVAISVHRIVASVFVVNEDVGVLVEVNHKNGIKKDNKYKNLEWVTSDGNKKNALETGLIKRGAELSYSKLVLDLQTGIYYESITEAANAKVIKNRTLHHWLIGDRKNKSSLILA